MPSSHLILCHPLLLLPSIFSSIRVFSELVLCMKRPKYWSFSFSISPSNEYSGLISFRINLFDLLAVQGNLKSLLQHHSSKASILWHSAFFIVQLSLLNKVKVHKLKKNQIAFNQNKQTTAPYLPFLPQSSRPWQALIHFASVDLPILDFSYIWNHKI